MNDVKLENSSQRTKDAIKVIVGIINNILKAHVSPRVDTLANLLLVSDAGDGEVATATDADARVVYKGNPSVGVPYYRAQVLANFQYNSPSIVLLTSVDTVISFTSAAIDTGNLTDDTDDSFLGVKLKNSVGTNKGAFLDLLVNVEGVIPHTAGTYIQAELEYHDGSNWVKFSTAKAVVAPLLSGSSGLPSYNLTLSTSLTLVSSLLKHRIVIRHDDTAVVPAVVTVTGAYVNKYGGDYQRVLS